MFRGGLAPAFLRMHSPYSRADNAQRVGLLLASPFELDSLHNTLTSILIPKYHINTQTTDNVSSLYFQRKTTGVSLTSLR